jgi:hypothetical protein
VARAISSSPNSSDRPSDISGLVILPSTTVMVNMTSDDHCYCSARGTRAIATSDGHSDTSGLSLLTPTVVIG